MDILIEVNGEVYRLPLTGEAIYTAKPYLKIRCAGIPSGNRGLTQDTLLIARAERVLLAVPDPPAYTTVEAITDLVGDLSHDTVQRILWKLHEQRQVTFVRPKEQRRGNVARRWMRVQ